MGTRPAEEADVEEGDEDDLNALPDRFASPPERTPPPPAFSQPQSYPERQPYSGDRPPYNGDRQSFNGDRQPSQERHDRNGYDRQRNDRSGPGRGPRPPYRDQDQRQDSRGQDNRGQEGRGPDSRSQEGRGQDYRNGGYREGNRDSARDQGGFGDRQPREAREQPRETYTEARPPEAGDPAAGAGARPGPRASLLHHGAGQGHVAGGGNGWH